MVATAAASSVSESQEDGTLAGGPHCSRGAPVTLPSFLEGHLQIAGRFLQSELQRLLGWILKAQEVRRRGLWAPALPAPFLCVMYHAHPLLSTRCFPPTKGTGSPSRVSAPGQEGLWPRSGAAELAGVGCGRGEQV